MSSYCLINRFPPYDNAVILSCTNCNTTLSSTAHRHLFLWIASYSSNSFINILYICYSTLYSTLCVCPSLSHCIHLITTCPGPRCIIPLDNTRFGKGVGSTTDFVITSASGDYVKSSKVIEDGRMEQGKHTEFVLRCTSESDRDAWVQTLQQESLRFKPLHEIFLRRRDQEVSTAPTERPLSIPEPIAEGWMRKRGAVNTGWKRRYFVMYPDFDGGGTTLFYYVSYQVCICMQRSVDICLYCMLCYDVR